MDVAQTHVNKKHHTCKQCAMKLESTCVLCLEANGQHTGLLLLLYFEKSNFVLYGTVWQNKECTFCTL